MKPLEKMIREEYISLTEGITYFENGKAEKQNYFVYWTIENKKTIFNSGNIVLVDNEKSSDSFRQAFSKKYKIQIPNSFYYTDIIQSQISHYRKYPDKINK